MVGEAQDGSSALQAAGRLRPELVLLDVNLPDLDGFQVAAHHAARGSPDVVLISSRDASRLRRLHRGRSGARGFIAKGELSGASLAEVLTTVGCSR